MSKRIYNFSAGPACLPEPVLKQAQKDLWDIMGSGIGILEHSHRGKVFDRITAETEASCRAITNIPDDYAVFWMQGGATSQCYFVPANFLTPDRTADYFETGKWAQDSIKEVPLYGKLNVCGSSKDKNFSYIPTGSQVSYSDNPAYVQFTANNTIMGTEFQTEPDAPGDAFLVSDASSNIFSRPIDVTKFGLIYAGAQKNLGPSGITLLIARKDLIEKPVRELPQMMQFGNHAKKEGRFNTPNTFGVYLMGEVFKWILAEGGLDAMRDRNEAKAAVLYDFLDAQDFFIPHAEKASRSTMNITFKCPTPELDAAFIEGAEKKGLDGLTGHRQIQGMRASMYNAFPKAGAEALVAHMKDFAREHAAAAKA
ncbi:MAG: 3-phosphoserine/phosphohydroxythreonine aminotransferase [Phycisphaeraceae bacterium]|nr:MAG: 3-phosphoserine/phosphohydroxythreonine aminotransferase [Phycisphaeraceae bacterium]